MRLICAEELKAALKNFVYLTEVSQHSDLVEGENIAFKKALELLDNAPTVEAEQYEKGYVDGYEAGQAAIIAIFEGMLNIIKAENLKEENDNDELR